MGDNTALAAAFEQALRTNDFARLMDMAREHATDDFHTEWPQSGERLTKEASLKMQEAYPQATGTKPVFAFKRMIGGGDVFVVEGTIDYGDGIPVSYIGISELRDGKVARLTEYFANPFEAPAWRADFVDRMEPAAT